MKVCTRVSSARSCHVLHCPLVAVFRGSSESLGVQSLCSEAPVTLWVYRWCCIKDKFIQKQLRQKICEKQLQHEINPAEYCLYFLQKERLAGADPEHCLGRPVDSNRSSTSLVAILAPKCSWFGINMLHDFVRFPTQPHPLNSKLFGGITLFRAAFPILHDFFFFF